MAALTIEERGSSEEKRPPAFPDGPQFAAATRPSEIRQLFFGTDGLRPGWAFAAYVAMFVPLQFAFSRLASLVKFGPGHELWAMPLVEFSVLLAAAVPAFVMGRIERRPWRSFGLPGAGAFGKLFWIGSIWGFGGITLLLGTLYGLHRFELGHLVLHGPRIIKFALFWALMFLIVGLFEEFMLRGYSQNSLARAIGFWPAAVVLSSIFGLIHLSNGGESWAGIVAAAAIGFFFVLTLRRTGTLWFAVGFHAAWDWGETFFYSVPDSGGMFPGHLLASSFHGPKWLTGGSVGPEGSVLCLIVIAMLWVGFSYAYPEVKWTADGSDVPTLESSQQIISKQLFS